MLDHVNDRALRDVIARAAVYGRGEELFEPSKIRHFATHRVEVAGSDLPNLVAAGVRGTAKRENPPNLFRSEAKFASSADEAERGQDRGVKLFRGGEVAHAQVDVAEGIHACCVPEVAGRRQAKLDRDLGGLQLLAVEGFGACCRAASPEGEQADKGGQQEIERQRDEEHHERPRGAEEARICTAHQEHADEVAAHDA